VDMAAGVVPAVVTATVAGATVAGAVLAAPITVGDGAVATDLSVPSFSVAAAANCM